MRTLRRKLRLCLIGFLVLSCASASCAAAARALGAVLCIGSDGHVIVEYAVIGDCAERDGLMPADHSASRDPHTVSAGSDHCGDCFDVAIAEPGGPLPKIMAVQNLLDFDFQSSLSVSLIASPHQTLAHLNSFRVVYDGHCPRRLLRERRSVVLVV